MKALIVILALVSAIPARADGPNFMGKTVGADSDVPYLDDEEPGMIRIDSGRVRPKGDHGQVDVGEGLYLNSAAAVVIAQELEGKEAENEELKKKLDEIAKQPSVDPKTVGIIAGSSFVLGIIVYLGASWLIAAAQSHK